MRVSLDQHRDDDRTTARSWHVELVVASLGALVGLMVALAMLG